MAASRSGNLSMKRGPLGPALAWASSRLAGFLGPNLASATGWLVLGTAMGRVSILGGYVLAARLLGVPAFGGLGAIQTTVVMLGTMAGSGLGLALARHVAYRIDDADRVGRLVMLGRLASLATGSAAGLGLALGAGLLATRAFSIDSLAGPLRLASPLVVLATIAGAQIGVLSGLNAFPSLALLHSVTGVANLLFLPLGAAAGNLPGAIIGLIAAQSVGVILGLILVRRTLKAKRIHEAWPHADEWRILWTSGLPATLNQSVPAPVLWVGSAWLLQGPDGLRQMALLTVANQWYTAFLFLPNLVAQALMPLLARARHDNRELLLKAIKGILMCLPLMLFGGVLSPWLMNLYGRGFTAGWPALAWTVATTGVLAVQMPIGALMAATDRMWLNLMLNLVWALVFLASAHQALSSGWGATGFALARFVAYVAYAGGTGWVASQYLRTRSSTNSH